MNSNSTLNGQQLELVNIINYGSPSLQKQNQGKTGQKSTNLYLHPSCPNFGFIEDGTPYTNIKKGKIIPWEKHPIFFKNRKGKRTNRYKISLRADIEKALGAYTNQYVHRLAMACYLGRELELWEEVCHINGNSADNSKSNLRASDCINNWIDEVELGRRGTSYDALLLARDRITNLMKNFETTN